MKIYKNTIGNFVPFAALKNFQNMAMLRHKTYIITRQLKIFLLKISTLCYKRQNFYIERQTHRDKHQTGDTAQHWIMMLIKDTETYSMRRKTAPYFKLFIMHSRVCWHIKAFYTWTSFQFYHSKTHNLNVTIFEYSSHKLRGTIAQGQ